MTQTAAPKRQETRDERRAQMLQQISEAKLWDNDHKRRQAVKIGQSVVMRSDDDFLSRHPADQMPGHIANTIASVESLTPRQIRVGCSRPRPETHGYSLPTYVLETCMADQPFIVDTIKVVLRRLGVRVLGSLNMILPVERDAKGNLVQVGAEHSAAVGESWTCHLLSFTASHQRSDEIQAAVRTHLERAQRIVQDFAAMTKLCADVRATLEHEIEELDYERRELREAAAFCDWLVDNHFVFMGAYGFDDQGRPTGRLGLGRYDSVSEAGCDSDPKRAFGSKAPVISMLQSRLDSPVHRRARMQEIRIPLRDVEGKPNGGVVFQGLFTYAALTCPLTRVPVMRSRLARMAVKENLVPRSHRMKLFQSFFNRLPLTYAFGFNNHELIVMINEAIDVESGGAARVHCAVNESDTVGHAFVIVDGERFGDKLRWKVQELIRKNFGADHVEFRLLLGRTDTAIWWYLLQSESNFSAFDADKLSDRVEAMVSPWAELMRDMLRQESVPDDRIEHLVARYSDCMPRDYCRRLTPAELYEDLQAYERVNETGKPQYLLRQDDIDSAQSVVRLLTFGSTDTALTDILPVLDDFGLRVLGETTSELADNEGRTLFFERYRLDLSGDTATGLVEHRESVLQAIEAVSDGRANSSTLNRLLLPARLTWQQLNVLRAYIGYARQLGTAFPPNVVQQALHDNAEVARTLVDLFDARFEPYQGAHGKKVSSASNADRKRRISEITEQFHTQLEAVSDVVTDKVLQMYFNLISATIRTNYFALKGAKRALSFKFRCADVELMSDPRPVFEIWVYDPRVEGVHLRGGPVARGGLRWSDRVDDFRTEVLGLMLTQQVKNTLIVPVGSKGGFVIKVPSQDDKHRRAQADELYKVFIHGLLDVTDNIVDDKVVFPSEVVVHDGPDPYLVVAADKGTAHLSDTANGIALERGFWLGDAFASGGSQGYDHKLYGITAKGAWVCVQRHFREMGVDTQKDEFSCVGIGDMSGDVFGNGMLLSKTIKLVGAFNHRHIFLDPNPQIDKSWDERKRLFDLPRSGWDDYDLKLISKGGGVWPRGAKSIELSAEVKARFGVHKDSVSGDEMVRCLLRAEVDLLWNGGIGTYVKASAETHSDADDKANDRVRVDADALRCKVLGEGGNLGFTHAGRVQFAMRGGRINTDAVDNSAGVDLSDHEVNLKILFAPLMVDGKLTMEERDQVLFEIDQQVCDDVMGDNYQHSLGLSVEEMTAPSQLRAWDRTVGFLCDKLNIDRELQDLPSSELLRERRHAQQGLTRPELARIHAFAKMWVYEQLVTDRESSRFVGERYLTQYFPDLVNERFGEAVANHKLRHEIICTTWGNEIVDYAGSLLLPTLATESERPVSDLCNAYWLAAESLDAVGLRAAIRSLDGTVAAQAQYEAFAELESVLAGTTRAILARCPSREDLATLMANSDAFISFARGAVGAVYKAQSTRRRAELVDANKFWERRGFSRDLSRRMMKISAQQHFIWVWEVAQRCKVPADRAALLWFNTGEVTGLSLVLGAPQDAAGTRWVAAARASLRQDLYAALLDVVIWIAGQLEDSATLRIPKVKKILGTHDELADCWALARQIPGERDQVAARIVLTNRLRNRLGALV